MKKLSKVEKEKLYKAIRYSYLKHEELLDLSLNPDFAGAKDYILEGLSYRLNSYEQLNDGTKKQIEINLKPRKNYGVEMEKKIIESHA